MKRHAQSWWQVMANPACVVAVFGLAGIAWADAPKQVDNRRTARSQSAGFVTGPTRHLQQAVAGGATMIVRLTPVAMHPDGMYANGGAYTNADISGETLTVRFGAFRSFWNVLLSDWDPQSGGLKLREWQVFLAAPPYDNGEGGPLAAPAVSCTLHSQCATVWGESAGSTCADGTCKYAWINATPRRLSFRFRSPRVRSTDSEH